MLNLGSLEFILGVNTRALDAAVGRVQAFADRVGKAQTAANRGVDNNISQLRKIENTVLKASESLNSLTAKIKGLKIAPEVKTGMIEELNHEFNKLTKGIAAAGKAADNTKIDRHFAKFNNSAAELNRRIRDTAQASREAGAAATQAANAQATAAKAAAGAYLRQQNALAGMIEKSRNLANTVELSKLPMPTKIGLVDRVQGEIAKMRAMLSGPEPLKPAEFTAAANKYKAAIGEINREFKTLKANQIAPAVENWDALKGRLQQLGSTMLLINGHLGGMSTRFLALSTILGVAGVKVAAFSAVVVTLGIGLNTMIKGALSATLVIQKAEQALQAVTGSSAIAASQFQFLRSVTDRTGTSFEGATRSYARFLAASRGAGQTYEQTQEQFLAVSYAAGKLALSVEDTEGTFRALEQMLSKGTVQAEELRGQLGDRLPGAFSIAAKAMGTTEQALNKMMKGGEVLARDFVPKFVAALKVAYNIDTSKPIDTLQAALTRAQNAVLHFFNAFAKNTKVVDLAKKAVEAFASTLDFLERNMDTIISTSLEMVKVIGALSIAWVAWTATASGGALIGFVVWVRNAVVAINLAAAATRGWAAAQAALNALLTVTGVGKLIGLLARLAVAILGAVVGYKLLNQWLNSSNSEFEDTSGIEAYISQQKALGWQVRQTTRDLLMQMKVMAANAGAKAIETADELRGALSSGRTAGDVWGSLTGSDRRGTLMEGAARARLKRIKALTDDTNRATANALKMSALVKDLLDVNTLPGEPPKPAGLSGDDDKAKGAKGAKDSIRSILDFIDALELLKEKQAALAEGPDVFEKFDKIHEARKALRDMSANELAMADEALLKAGFSTGTLEQRLASLLIQTDQSAKSVAAFTDAWRDLEDMGKDIETLTQKIQYFMNSDAVGGEEQFDNLRKASDVIKDMKPDALEALKKTIEALPFGFYIASASADDLKNALAQLYDYFDLLDKKANALKEFNQDLAKVFQDIASATYKIAGLNKGLRDSDLSNWTEQQEAIAYWTKTLREAGVAAEDVSKKIAKLNTAYDQKGLADKALESAEQLATFKDNLAQAFADAAGQIVMSFGNIWDAAKSLIQRLTQLFVEQFVVQPIFDWAKGITGSIGIGKQSSGADLSKVASFADNAGLNSLMVSATNASVQINMLGNAALSAATSLSSASTFDQAFSDFNIGVDASTQSLVRNTGELDRFGSTLPMVIQQLLSAGGGGGGGGLIGSLLSIGASAFGGGLSSSFGSAMSSVNSNLAAIPIRAPFSDFAEGGSVQGPGTSTSDSIDAKLSDGEFVFKSEAVRKWGVSTLEAMNSGRAQRLAEGGYVSRGSTPRKMVQDRETTSPPIKATFVFPNATSAREIRESEGQAGRRLRRTLRGPVRGR